MKKAIITGSTGLVGMAVARHLYSLGIELLCLGRQIFSQQEIVRNFGAGSSYMRLEMESIASLPKHVEGIGWSPGGECVFFHFAWGGLKRLTDGQFVHQINNAVHTAEAVRSAKQLGCIKFVNAGSFEETIVEKYLEGERDVPYHSSQTDYALAKLAARDMCKIIAYLEKIDYVHTRISIPLASDLSRGTYVATTLKKILEGEPYELPSNEQLIDIVLTDDVARAYYLIGLKGKNKADYFIGTSNPTTLKQYFMEFERLVNSGCSNETQLIMDGRALLFDTKTLHRDTGFVATSGCNDIIHGLLRT